MLYIGVFNIFVWSVYVLFSGFYMTFISLCKIYSFNVVRFKHYVYICTIINNKKIKSMEAINNQKVIRKMFWSFLSETNPELFKFAKKSKKQNEQTTDIRIAFCDYIEYLRCEDVITEKMAYKVTL